MSTNAINTNRIPVLWIDDEWNTNREGGLEPWLRALRPLEKDGLIDLTICNSLVEFATVLRTKSTTGAMDSGRESKAAFGLIILDVKLTNETETHFTCLGFDGESVIPYEAGAQIAEFMRSTMYDGSRPAWLQEYVQVPLVVLSSFPSVDSNVFKRVGRSRLGELTLVTKSLVQQPSFREHRVEASEDFVDAVRTHASKIRG